MTAAANKHCILIIGATGQIGSEIASLANSYEFQIFAPSRSDIDITDQISLRKALRAHRPDIVINAAAYTNVDGAETDRETAFSVNAEGPAGLAVECEATGTPLFHISTDYVFDGGALTPYRETDEVHPLNVYGASKAAGESSIRKATERHIILRTSWVFGREGKNFVKSILQQMETRSSLKVVNDERGNPSGASDIAQALLFLSRVCMTHIKAGRAPSWGTYHFCNEKSVTRHEFAEAIVAAAARRGMKKCDVVPVSSSEFKSVVHRPKNSALDCGLIKKTFGVTTRSWEPCLNELLDTMLLNRQGI